MSNGKDTKDREVLLERLLDAPVELVWEAWTDPEHIAKWWGPNGFTNTISKMDIKPGGEWNLVMHGPDGTDYRNESIFKEVVKYKKLVYEHITGPKFTSTIEFESRGDKTFLKWHMVFESKEIFMKAVEVFKVQEGLKQNGEKLNLYLAGMMNK